MIFTYLKQPPNKWTFKMPRLRKWTEDRCLGKVLNLFAGKIRLEIDEYRVDISDEFSPDHVGDSLEFLLNTDLKFDTVLLDPPYNIRKSRESYEGKWIGSLRKIKDALPRVMNENCRVISYGYDSVGMSESRGFVKKEICLICHSGDYNDTIVVLEDRGTITKPKQLKYKQGDLLDV